ncbi:MAG: nucleotidyltransferase family protein [Chloroflexi bacterium]|nr:nucleotidyltransferase family protein [Chloroflexota bacterium]
MHDRSLAAVVLAAGLGSRFGRPKAGVRIGGRTLLGVAVDTATAAGLHPVVAVVPAGVSVPPGALGVTNAQPGAGLSRSLQLGLGAVPSDRDAAVILLADQPTVGVALLRRLLGARGRTPVIATVNDGVLGPPVLVERAAFDLADRLVGDVGLRQLLRGVPDEVTPVEPGGPIPDVDTPADLERVTEPCPGCAERYLPHVADETHPYIGASAACWATYGELLARELEDMAYGRMHRHSADVYAVQHPGHDDRRQRQSVALHLVAICQWLEHELPVELVNAITQRLARSDRVWPWLTPPASFAMTVADVLQASTGEAHAALVRRWGIATWEAWSDHHDTVRDWAREALGER